MKLSKHVQEDTDFDVTEILGAGILAVIMVILAAIWLVKLS